MSAYWGGFTCPSLENRASKMREIKFRAWDTTEEKMWYKDEDFPTYLNEFRFNDYIKQLQKDDVVLMQYTGLKDKNGVEIYEGDVVRTLEVKTGNPAFVLKLAGMEITTTVIWSDGGFILRDKLGNTTDYTLLAELTAIQRNPGLELEVIGNIYEDATILSNGVDE